ncbi:MAG: NAD kinase [Ferrovum sp. 37-45-19]|uniref:NAD(+) kinase n=1 Tax=Ferrovum sp. JA12 TaxID=1356299 RepID=UPI000703A928|nr:NAD(+) kinase [Ferrovum sp. JA12]OYV80227.1 MAG: NAD kinase [Ferrovum sp. 21-44-67]OYV94504.1 MAG: NAD kinase [Ferrovum sp. 37-45-19]OZB33876.1 MAG: NAD kinase [Ferrovum sp. 34-44-207]HQT81597.1 NAD(+) kinase [Ferrovaceae bacterium]KRH78908.1 NAD kinase [Ferrovum sp. JA12]
MNTIFQKIGIVGKYNSHNLSTPMGRLIQFLEKYQLNYVLDPKSAASVPSREAEVIQAEDMGKHVDLVVVLGGDGTLLSVARSILGQRVPLVGINLGQLGFLTDIPSQNLEEELAKVLNGHFAEEKRSLLETEIWRQGHLISRHFALNDVVLTKGAQGSMIELEVSVDHRFVYSLRADGLIAATPTGSTAYALSSGGPIIHPELQATVLVPICPHTLSNRPIVLSDRSVIEVILQKGKGAFANFDVQDHMALLSDDRLIISHAKEQVTLLHPLSHDYYAMLREKLRWGTKL